MIDQEEILPYSFSFPREEYVPTFGISLKSNAALVVGSDRNTFYFSPETGDAFSSQRFEADKFIRNADETVICVCAGGMPSITAARNIALNAKPEVSEAAWQKSLEDIAMAAPRPQPWPFDEILVIRPDNPSGVWIVTRREGTASVVKNESHICIGDRSHARLLPAILWNPDLSADRLEVLARLTLSYASLLNPSGVGFGFDILTIRPGQVSWKQFPVDGFERPFTSQIIKAFEELPAI